MPWRAAYCLGSTTDLPNSSTAKTAGYTYGAFGTPTSSPPLLTCNTLGVKTRGKIQDSHGPSVELMLSGAAKVPRTVAWRNAPFSENFGAVMIGFMASNFFRR